MTCSKQARRKVEGTSVHEPSRMCCWIRGVILCFRAGLALKRRDAWVHRGKSAKERAWERTTRWNRHEIRPAVVRTTPTHWGPGDHGRRVL